MVSFRLTLVTTLADNSFNAALRVGMELDELLPHLYAVLQPCSAKQMRTSADMCMLENGIPSVPGGVEVMGALEFISSIVMQSVTQHGVYTGTRYYTTLFPSINRSEAASFTRLRARGAFLITASWDATKQVVVSPVILASEAGQEFVLVNPWGSNKSVVVRSNGTTVQIVMQAGRLRFPTQAGRTYEISTTADL